MPLNIDKLRLLREKLGLTQQQAAVRAGMKNRQHWNEIETGRRSGVTVETLEKIAVALRVKAKDLLK